MGMHSCVKVENKMNNQQEVKTITCFLIPYLTEQSEN